MMNSELATLLAGFGGAVVGGLLTAIIQLQSIKYNRNMKLKASSSKLFIVIRNVYFQTLNYEHTMCKLSNCAIEEILSDDSDNLVWRLPGALLGIEEVENISAEDLSPLFITKNYNLIDDCQSILSLNRRLFEIKKKYSEEYEILIKKVGVEEASGQGKGFVIRREKINENIYIVKSLNNLVKDVIRDNNSLKNDAADVAERLADAMIECFGEAEFPNIKFPGRPRRKKKAWWEEARTR